MSSPHQHYLPSESACRSALPQGFTVSRASKVQNSAEGTHGSKEWGDAQLAMLPWLSTEDLILSRPVRAGGKASFALYRGYVDQVKTSLGDTARRSGAA